MTQPAQPSSNQSGLSQADLRAFLAHNVEGYVFTDLANMQQTTVGYPMVMTAFACIELLGALLSENPFDAFSGVEYFCNYWTQYLYPGQSTNAADAIYRLARHGIAHAYVPKGAIGVLGGRPNEHLRINNGLLLIDVWQLKDDLIKSYQSRVLPLVGTTAGTVNGTTMAGRLFEMEQKYASQANSVGLSALFPTAVSIGTLLNSAGAPSQSNAPSAANASAAASPGGATAQPN